MARCKPTSTPAVLTPAEREYMHPELSIFFSTLPTVAGGFTLKRWASGPRRGQPKVPQAAAGLVARGLMRLDVTAGWPPLLLTNAGLAALRAMMADARLVDLAKFAHVRRELGAAD